MDRISILQHIQKNSNLLSLPQILSEVLQEVGKEDFSPDSLAKIILKDPSLTSRVLKLSNSAFYHRMSEIKTVHQAISLMGVTTVKCLALSSSIFHPEKISRDSGIDAKEFFCYVLSVGAAARKIAETVNFRSSEEAFIAGLLHDVGLMFFLYNYPKEYRTLIGNRRGDATLVEAEQELFGIDHSDISYHMAEAWGLPADTCEAIRGHHKWAPHEEGSQLKSIVRIAVLLTSDRFSGYELSLEDRLSQITTTAEQLALTKEQIDEISGALLRDAFEIAEYLGVDIGDIETMLISANQEIWKTYLIVENLFKERQELSQSLLEEERARGAMESKNIAMATLSHYLNNAIMAIYGRSQIMRLFLSKGKTDRLLEQLPNSLQSIDNAVKKVVAVLDEMKEISPIGEQEYYSMSKALNIDDRIASRLEQMNEEGHWDELIERPSRTTPAGC